MANLLTRDAVKTRLGVELDDDTYDAKIDAALPLVTEWFEQYCQRGLARRTIADEEVFFNDVQKIFLWCFPLVSLASVEVDGALVPGSSYVLNKKQGYIFPGTMRSPVEVGTRLVVSYVGGYDVSEVPADLADAFATAVGVKAAVPTASAASGGSGAIKSIGLGGGALSVAFDTGTAIGGISGAFSVADVPVQVQNYASVLDYYKRHVV
jgi:hypothetical protein